MINLCWGHSHVLCVPLHQSLHMACTMWLIMDHLHLKNWCGPHKFEINVNYDNKNINVVDRYNCQLHEVSSMNEESLVCNTWPPPDSRSQTIMSSIQLWCLDDVHHNYYRVYKIMCVVKQCDITYILTFEYAPYM